MLLGDLTGLLHQFCTAAALHHAARKGQSAALVAILDALQQSGHMLAKPMPQLDAMSGALTWRLQPPAQSRAGVVQQVLDTMTTRGCTALMLAAHHGRCEALQLLLEAGADALMLDKGDRRTALHHASMMGHADAVCTLLSASIIVNVPGGQQTVALGSAQLRDGTKQVARYANDNRLAVIAQIRSTYFVHWAQSTLNLQQYGMFNNNRAHGWCCACLCRLTCWLVMVTC